jgi:hypothetical protein
MSTSLKTRREKNTELVLAIAILFTPTLATFPREPHVIPHSLVSHKDELRLNGTRQQMIISKYVLTLKTLFNSVQGQLLPIRLGRAHT